MTTNSTNKVQSVVQIVFYMIFLDVLVFLFYPNEHQFPGETNYCNIQRPGPGLFIVRIIEKPMPKCQRSSRLVDTLQEAAETKGEYYFIQ